MARKKFFLIGLAATLGFFLWKKPDDRFSVERISSSLPSHSEWATNASIEPIRALFEKPFTFLGEGAQAYAFESSDKAFVLKLFKMERLTPSWNDYLCPHLVKRRLKNLRYVFNGYKTGFTHFQQDTGLAFIHLAKTTDLHQTAIVIDRQGIHHTIDLDRTEFVLQEKAELIFDRLNRLYAQGSTEELDQAIASVLALIQRRIDHGYADRDKAVTNNFGFVGDRPIQLDIGRLYKGSKEGQLEHVQRRIDYWRIEQMEKENSASPMR